MAVAVPCRNGCMRGLRIDRNAPERKHPCQPADASGYSLNPEMPHRNEANTFVAHTVTLDAGEVMNYAFERDNEKACSVGGLFIRRSNCRGCGQPTDAWSADPDLPVEMPTTREDFKSDGFDSGHLCASEDRVLRCRSRRAGVLLHEYISADIFIQPGLLVEIGRTGAKVGKSRSGRS